MRRRMARGERALLAAWLGIAVLGGSPVSAESPMAPAPTGWLGTLDRGLGDAVSPGELARAHAALSGIAHCADCHAGLDATPDDRCVACHADVGRRMADASGFHGSLRGDCASCHGEHRGAEADLLGLDRKAFNHELARFPLRGAHPSVDCAECHTREGSDGTRGFHPIGIDHERCGSCHQDVHGEPFRRDRDCDDCHTQQGFGAAQLAFGGARPVFDHDADTGFALTGRHASLACGDCHTDATRAREQQAKLAPGRGAPGECGSCHRDPHDAALGSVCASCHTTEGWTGAAVRFDHARDTAFPLDATHARADCASCHADRRFSVASTRCEGCHADAAELLAGRFRGNPPAEPDPHHGRVACAECHTGQGAGAPLVDFARACLACHPAEYGSLLLSRQRIVDGLLVEAGAELRSRGGESPPAELQALAQDLAVLARSSAHHPALAESVLRALRDRLHARGGER